METVLRVVFVYVLVWGCFRVLGKRELTQMSPFELVTLLFIPQLFSRALTRQDYSMTNAVIGATTLFLLVILTSAASYHSRRFARVGQGSRRYFGDNRDAASCCRRSQATRSHQRGRSTRSICRRACSREARASSG